MGSVILTNMGNVIQLLLLQFLSIFSPDTIVTWFKASTSTLEWNTALDRSALDNNFRLVYEIDAHKLNYN